MMDLQSQIEELKDEFCCDEMKEAEHKGVKSVRIETDLDCFNYYDFEFLRENNYNILGVFHQSEDLTMYVVKQSP